MADENLRPAAGGALTMAAAGALAGVAVGPKNANAPLYEVDELKPATETAASGALVEPTIVERVDTGHPAIDNNPRLGQCVAANRLDMNDPSVDGHVQVTRMLGMTEGEPAAPEA